MIYKSTGKKDANNDEVRNGDTIRFINSDAIYQVYYSNKFAAYCLRHETEQHQVQRYFGNFKSKDFEIINSKSNNIKKKNSEIFDIRKKKPSKDQEIFYEGNHGYSKGTFLNLYKNVGWVLCEDDGIDCFTFWKEKN